jgi:hypothetical protein
MSEIVKLFLVSWLEASLCLLFQVVLNTSERSHQALLKPIPSVGKEIFTLWYLQALRGRIIKDSGVVGTAFPSRKNIDKFKVEIYGCKNVLSNESFAIAPGALNVGWYCSWYKYTINGPESVLESFVSGVFADIVWLDARLHVELDVVRIDVYQRVKNKTKVSKAIGAYISLKK